MLRRTVFSVVAGALLAGGGALVGASPSGADPISPGCEAINQPFTDGVYAAVTFPDPLEFDAGDQLTITAVDPTLGATSFSLEVPARTTVGQAAIPGTVTHTFAAGATSVYWSVDQGLATFTTVCTPAVRAADLSIAKQCGNLDRPNDPSPVGSLGECDIVVANIGEGTATDVVVSDDLPAGLTAINAPSGGASCGTGDPLVCTIPSIPPGSGYVLSYNYVIDLDAPAGSTLTNTVTVTTTALEVGPGPNTATATVAVAACTISGSGDLIGTPGDDVICGSAGPDRIYGLGGHDTIYGLDGDDRLLGGDGNDNMIGGAGADQLSGAAGDDQLHALDGAGGDVVLGGTHVFFDRCLVDAGDLGAQCEVG